eukprot:scaffold22649_cov66-Cyclotella_meneghiniana.AAC.4
MTTPKENDQAGMLITHLEREENYGMGYGIWHAWVRGERWRNSSHYRSPPPRPFGLGGPGAPPLIPMVPLSQVSTPPYGWQVCAPFKPVIPTLNPVKSLVVLTK